MGRGRGQGWWYRRDGALAPLVALSALIALALQESGAVTVFGVVPNLMLSFLFAWALAGVSPLTGVAASFLIAGYAVIWMPFNVAAVVWYLALALLAFGLRSLLTTYRVFDMLVICIGAQLASWSVFALQGLPRITPGSQGIELLLNFVFGAAALPLAVAAVRKVFGQ